METLFDTSLVALESISPVVVVQVVPPPSNAPQAKDILP